MKRLCWFALWLNLTTGWAADLVKVWQFTTNQLGIAPNPASAGSIASLEGVSSDGASLLRFGQKIFWISDGRVLWTAEPTAQTRLVPLLLSATNLVLVEVNGVNAGPVHWWRRVGEFVGEKLIGLPNNQTVSMNFDFTELTERYLPGEQIPHFLTASSTDGTITCWRLDDPEIWPAPSVSASITNGQSPEARIVNRSGLPIDLQTSTNLTNWTSFRRISALPSTNVVALPTIPENKNFLRAVPAEP